MTLINVGLIESRLLLLWARWMQRTTRRKAAKLCRRATRQLRRIL